MAEAARLEGERVFVREMQHRDLAQMQAWRPYADPLCHLWNLPPHAQTNPAFWFSRKRFQAQALQYVIERQSDGQIIGRLSLRDMNERISVRLGIRLGADFVNQGYGTEALQLFLHHCFHTLGFRRLYLDVAAINRRAIRVYERLGFQHTGSHHRNVPSDLDLRFLEQEQYRGMQTCFRRWFGRTQLVFLDMVLERSDWEHQDLRADSRWAHHSSSGATEPEKTNHGG